MCLRLNENPLYMRMLMYIMELYNQIYLKVESSLNLCVLILKKNSFCSTSCVRLKRVHTSSNLYYSLSAIFSGVISICFWVVMLPSCGVLYLWTNFITKAFDITDCAVVRCSVWIWICLKVYINNVNEWTLFSPGSYFFYPVTVNIISNWAIIRK